MSDKAEGMGKVDLHGTSDARVWALCGRMADHVRYFVNDGMSLHKLTTGTKEQMQKDLAEFDREAGNETINDSKAWKPD